MKKTLALLTVILALTACGDAEKAETSSNTATAKNNSLTLQDGTKINISGTVVKVMAKPNDKGELKMHEVKFDSGAKIAENSVYSKLSKLGYSRKIIENTDKNFKVHYYKKDQPVIGSIYQEQDTSTGQSSQLSLYWQSI